MRFLIFVALAACAHDLVVQFPAAPGDPAGTIVVLFSQPASDVVITVDGVLVASEAHTGRVRIDHAPIGTVEVSIAANGGEKTVKAWVSSERPTTIPVGIPDASMGFVKTLFGTLVTIVAYSLLH